MFCSYIVWLVRVNIDQTSDTHEFITRTVDLWKSVEYRTRDHCIRVLHLFCDAFVHLIYSGVPGQYSHADSLVSEDVGMHGIFIFSHIYITYW